MSIRLVPIFVITIPPIIRVGEATTKISLSNLNFSVQNDTIPVLGLTFNRIGSFKSYGDLSVVYISPAGKKTEVGRANGIAVCTPYATCKFMVSLIRKPSIDYKTSTLHVEYTAPGDVKVTFKYAEADLLLK